MSDEKVQVVASDHNDIYTGRGRWQLRVPAGTVVTLVAVLEDQADLRLTRNEAHGLRVALELAEEVVPWRSPEVRNLLRRWVKRLEQKLGE